MANSNTGQAPTPGTTLPPQPSQAQMNPLDPPALKTLVYAPDVQILIEHSGVQYDVSADLVRGTIVRKENAASTLMFTVANKGRRYYQLFGRMDRVVVNMKRVDWVQVFSGYLDTIPWIQAYPGVVSFKATCTLKRLLYTWWNPALQASQNLFDQQGYGQIQEGDANTSQTLDSGLGLMLRQLLMQVGGWAPQNIHIQNFPAIFYSYLTSQLDATQSIDSQLTTHFANLIEGQNIAAGPGAYAGADPTAGPAGPYLPSIGAGGGAGSSIAGLSTAQAFYVQQIITTCDGMGMGPNATNLEYSQSTSEAGAEGAAPVPSGMMSEAAVKQLQQSLESIGQDAQALNEQTQSQDAAILGVCCVLTETGLRMLANSNVPESLNFDHDGVGNRGNSCGLFQQQYDQGWGTVSQEMDARQSSVMFFTHLNRLNWQNMAPQAAIQAVQGSSYSDGSNYAAHLDEAAAIVTAYRMTIKATTTAARDLAATATNAVPGVDLANPALLDPTKEGTLPGTVTPLPATPNAASSYLGKPNPDSEGAINCGMAQIGKPYRFGGAGPLDFDCSGLMQWAYRGIGIAIGRDTDAQRNTLTHIQPTQIQRGDLIQCEGGEHTFMYLGPLVPGGVPQILEAADYGIPVRIRDNYVPLNEAYCILNVCQNGGIDPTVGYTDPATGGPGMPPSAVNVTTGVGGGTGGGGAGLQEPIARNLFDYMFRPGMYASSIAEMFTGENVYIDDQPLIQMVAAVASAGLRNFASAPNGDFVAYYPDYFGTEGKPVSFQLQDIELKDLKIDLSDDPLTTHVYVVGNLDPTGAMTGNPMDWFSASATASVENEWLYARMRAVAPGDSPDTMLTGQQLMYRFGVRPLTQSYSMAADQGLDVMIAAKIFMERWAAQYQTAVSMTFMPELFPGMRVELAGHGLQVYASEVTHNFDFEGGGFSTEAIIMAPSSPAVIANANAATAGMIPTVTIGAGGQISPSEVPTQLNPLGVNGSGSVLNPGGGSVTP